MGPCHDTGAHPEVTRIGTHLAHFIQVVEEGQQAIRDELLTGLTAPHAHISPKYLYDALGSKLFEAICELAEYYPTRTEAAIFDRHIEEIAEAVGPGSTLIDLGAGNCAKAVRLFPALRPAQYVPVDISVDFLRGAVNNLRPHFPQIEMLGVGLDFSSSLALPEAVRAHKRLFFYPGSSIGNFSPDQALAFLLRLRAACQLNGHAEGGLLIGVDLIKDKTLLDAAYDDSLAVTAAFNLNLLLHLNRLLGTNFNVADWQHRGYFNTDESRIEMHLQARRTVRVAWQGGERSFDEGERIHTENSYKYTQDGFVNLLREAGFADTRVWTDDNNWFMVCLARAEK